MLPSIPPADELNNLRQIYYVSDTSANWALYLCGIKQIILDGLVQNKIQDEESVALRDWIYFYEVLARFSLVHWFENPHIYPICFKSPQSNLIQILSDRSSRVIARSGKCNEYANATGRMIFAPSDTPEKPSMLSPA